MDPCETCKKYGFTRDHECHYPISVKGLKIKIFKNKNHDRYSNSAVFFNISYIIPKSFCLLIMKNDERNTTEVVRKHAQNH